MSLPLTVFICVCVGECDCQTGKPCGSGPQGVPEAELFLNSSSHGKKPPPPITVDKASLASGVRPPGCNNSIALPFRRKSPLLFSSR